MARYLVDTMCGKLARYLRFCGHDAAYIADRSDAAELHIELLSSQSGRTLITRDRTLAGKVEGAILLTCTDIDNQLAELADAGVELTISAEPRRCGSCNGPLVEICEKDTTPSYAPSPAEQAVYRCTDCGQCFWRGSHWDRVRDRLNRVIQ